MTSKELQETKSKLDMTLPFIQRNELYVDGRNPAILNKEAGKKPDNRIPVANAKVTVDQMSGYAGRQGDIVTTYELVDAEVEAKDDPFIVYTREMDAYNKEPLETSELYEEGLTQGKAYEIWWTSDKKDLSGGLLTAEYKIVPASSVWLKYSNSIKPELLHGVYFSSDEEAETEVADVYFPDFKEVWNKQGSGEWALIETIEYPFSTVPINVFTINRKAIPLFNAGVPLIDAYDNMISKSLNEVDRFNAAITLLGDSVDTEFVRKLSEGLISVIDDLGDAERTDVPRYMEKNFGGVDGFYNTLADRVKNDYHRVIASPDMSNSDFASGDPSGVARAFKLLGMEYSASKIETYFNQGLERRLHFYADIYNKSVNQIDVDDYKAAVKSTRNLPIDDKVKAEIAQILSTLVSEETLLKFLPKTIVDDVAKEMERKAAVLPTDVLGLTGGVDGTPEAVEVAKLSGIQITAANEIITKVAEGLLSREAGIQQLMTFLGLTREQAEAVMGQIVKKPVITPEVE